MGKEGEQKRRRKLSISLPENKMKSGLTERHRDTEKRSQGASAATAAYGSARLERAAAMMSVTARRRSPPRER